MVQSVLKNIKSPKSACDIVFIFAITLSIVVLLVIHYNNFGKLQGEDSLLVIKDVLKAKEKSLLTGSIFFHKTGIHLPSRLQYLALFSFFQPEILKFYSAELTAREGCAIESAALHNPKTDVFVIFLNQSNWMNNKMSPILSTVLTYPNVHVRTVNLRRYLKNTPLEDWLDKGHQELSLIEKNAIKLMRFVSLWRWGGVYLDFNTIVLRGLEDLQPNYLVANEETNQLTTSILSCFHLGIGHFLSKRYLTSYMRYLNEENSIENYDQQILEMVVQELCRRTNVSEIVRQKNCFGLNVYGSKYFGDATLQPEIGNSSLSRLVRNVNRWYAVYNRVQSLNQSIYENVIPGAQDPFAMKHCPKVFKKAEALGL